LRGKGERDFSQKKGESAAQIHTASGFEKAAFDFMETWNAKSNDSPHCKLSKKE
jgi:hypothetical protein